MKLSIIAAVVAAAALVVEGATVAAGGAVPDHHWGTQGQVVNTAFIVAAVALIVASQALPALLSLPRWGRSAVVASQIGLLAMTIESVASGIHGGNTLGGLFFGGLLLLLLGSLVYGVAGLRSGRLKWAAMLPFLGLLVGIAGGDHGGSIAWGAVWLLLAVQMTAAARLDSPVFGHRPAGA